MKKYIALLLALVCVLGLVGCSTNKVDKAKPVFETENIVRITFHTLPSDGKGFEVPSTYMAEITSWLGSFTIDEKADDKVLAPGSNSISVEIEYADGTVVKNGLTTTKVDGVTYYMKAEDAPQCYFEILEQTNSNNKEATPNKAFGAYTYEELSEMPAKELLDLFIQNGLVINDDLKKDYTEEKLQTIFKENFHLWHTGVSAHSYTMYCDLAEQTKAIYDKIVTPSTPSNDLPDNAGPGDVINNSNS